MAIPFLEYEPIVGINLGDSREVVTLMKCPECGSLVIDPSLHYYYHVAEEQ